MLFWETTTLGMNNFEKAIQNLRDIHMPEPISTWPLAPGWYFLYLLLLFLTIVIIYFIYQFWKKHCLKKQIFHELQKIETLMLTEESTAQAISKISILLKRIAFLKYPRVTVASLHGNEWLTFLDYTGKTQAFTQGVGKLLVTLPYQKQQELIPAEFFDCIKKWIRQNL